MFNYSKRIFSNRKGTEYITKKFIALPISSFKLNSLKNIKTSQARMTSTLQDKFSLPPRYAGSEKSVW